MMQGDGEIKRQVYGELCVMSMLTVRGPFQGPVLGLGFVVR